MTTNGNDNRTEMKLDQITKMLSALLKSTNNLHVVDAYAWGYTDNDDPFLVLYPAGDHLKHKVCRVYPHEFGKLPAEIIATKPDAGPKDPGDRDRAIKSKILHTCPLMGIVTYDGKETQMGPEKRFSDVIWVSRKGQPQQRQDAPPAQSQAKAQTQTRPPAANGKPKAEVNPAGADVNVAEECIKFAKSVYMEDWARRLAELCRQHSEGKISGIGELNTAQATRVRESLLLRREFHLLGAKKFGNGWPAKCQKTVRQIGGELFDYDSELTDEQVQRLINGLKTLIGERA